MKSIRLVEVPSEIGAGTRGASLGPKALLLEDVSEEKILAPYSWDTIVPENRALSGEPRWAKAKFVEVYTRVASRVQDHLEEILRSGDFPIMLSGDHSNAYGSICGLKKCLGNKKLGVVWIDAHADLHTPFSTPSGNLHGMPLGMALGLGADVDRDDPLTELWKDILHLGDSFPKLDPKNLVFIGVRDTEAAENKVIRENGIPNFTVDAIRSEGVQAILEKARMHLQACDAIYVSFDVDSMDPDEVSYGTGTPVKGGLSFLEALELNMGLAQWPELRCWEMTEVNPLLDQKNAMAKAGLKVLQAMLNTLEGRRKA